jgi:hypothetical protein
MAASASPRVTLIGKVSIHFVGGLEQEMAGAVREDLEHRSAVVGTRLGGLDGHVNCVPDR